MEPHADRVDGLMGLHRSETKAWVLWIGPEPSVSGIGVAARVCRQRREQFRGRRWCAAKLSAVPRHHGRGYLNHERNVSPVMSSVLRVILTHRLAAPFTHLVPLMG